MLPNLRALAIAVALACLSVVFAGVVVRTWNALDSAVRAARAGRRWARTPTVLIALTLALTMLAALQVPDLLMATRLHHMAEAIRGWNYAHTLLTFRTPSGYAVLTDDPGVYLLAPLFASHGWSPEFLETFLGIGARVTLLVLAAVTLVAYRGAWRSRPAAYLLLCAACAVCVLLGTHVSQQYWMPVVVAWSGALLLTPTAATPSADREEHRRNGHTLMSVLGCVALVLVTVACAIARESSALVGAIALLTYAVVGRRSTPGVARASAILGAVVVLAGPGWVTTRLYDARDATLRAEGDTVPAERGAHPRWHSIYIGLAIPGRPFGYDYADSVAINAAHRIDPTVVYPTATYDRVVEGMFASLARAHPWTVARQFLEKGAILLAMVFVIWTPLLVRERQRQDGLLRRTLGRYAPIVLAGLLPGVLVAPVLGYASAGIGGAIIALGCAAAALERPPSTAAASPLR